MFGPNSDFQWRHEYSNQELTFKCVIIALVFIFTSGNIYMVA